MTTTSPLTTDTFTEHEHPVWRVAGPLGIVTYHALGNQVYVEPIGCEGDSLADRHANEIKMAAAAGTDEDVLLLLTGWYHRLPELGTVALGTTGDPETDRWRALRGEELTAEMMAACWYANPDDLIGGWVVGPVDKPASTGAPQVASFMDEGAARHIVDLHNAHVREEELRAVDRARMAEILAARPDIQPGDLIDVPAGADRIVTTRHRVVAETLNDYGICGYKIKADGKPQVSRSGITATKDGYLGAIVSWFTATKSTVIRDGKAIYTPEGTQ